MLKLDWLSFLLVILLLFLSFFFVRKSKRASLSLFYSDISFFKGLTPSLRLRLAILPRILQFVTLIFFVLAFIDPHFLIDRDLNMGGRIPEEGEEGGTMFLPREGIAMYLVLDKSGSMQQPMSRGMSRLDVLKDLTAKFVNGDEQLGGRSNDLIGLVTFARLANVDVPLTLDHEAITTRLKKLSVARTNQENGTAIGYALFKTANLIQATKHFSKELIEEGRPSYDIASTVIILVTDGIQEPNPADEGHLRRSMSIPDAVKAVVKAGIKTYVINVNPDIRHPRFAKAKRELEQIAEDTGGKFYIADNSSSLMYIYQEIDNLEVTALPQEDIVKVVEKSIESPQYKRISLYPYFIAAGMICLFISIILSTTWLRRTP
jgi:Ca-activated chloride channel homolog